MTGILKAVMELPNTFMALNKKTQWNVEQTIRSLVPEIERSCDKNITKDIQQVLVSMSDTFEDKFT